MRTIFIDTLTELAEKDERIMLLTGDMGFSVLEKFREKFPHRFFNAGVAEQNMMSVASGLALSGKIVFVYSIIPFLIMRCFEQVRNDICFQNLNVRLIGIGAGLSYGSAGSTHYALEDIAIMRPLPNMTILAPGDAGETEACARASIYHKGPVYIRLFKGVETKAHPGGLTLKIGKGIILEEGKDITVITSGSMLFTARQVCNNLRHKGLSVRLVSMPSIKPLDKSLIVSSAKKTKVVFTIEEHSEVGGLGSAVGEILAEAGTGAAFKKFAIKDECQKSVGSHRYLLRMNGLSAEALTKDILRIANKVAK